MTQSARSHLVVESLDRVSREGVLDAAARLLDLLHAGIVVVTLGDKQEYSEERRRADWTPLVAAAPGRAAAVEDLGDVQLAIVGRRRDS